MTADVFVADRSVQLEKLKLDIATATANAEQHGIALHDIIVALLQRHSREHGVKSSRSVTPFIVN